VSHQYRCVRSSASSTAGVPLRHGDTSGVAALPGSDIPPLHWWRSLPASAFTAAHLAVIRRAIAGFSYIGEPRWPLAAKGDAAAAVGVALRAIKHHEKPTPSIDLVMSALVRCAIEGSHTACLVLDHALARLSDDGPSSEALAASWRTKPVMSRAPHEPKGA
jgi:hypothetical protein